MSIKEESMEAGRLPMGELVYGRERVLFAVMLLVSLLLYGSLVTLALSDASTGGVFLFYGVLLAFGGFVAHAFALGRIRGNGVLVTERQFPFLQQMVNAHARQLGLTYSPTVYVHHLLQERELSLSHKHTVAADAPES